MILDTPRLRLRPLTDDDLEPCAAMLADPEVMRYVSPTPLSRQVVEAAVAHYRGMAATRGYGWWAIDVKDGPSFAGVIMLKDVEFSAAFTPALEVGWLLPQTSWGRGYATEGARAALDYAFSTLNLDEVVAITTAVNAKSQRVMTRLGMTHDLRDDFDHPQISDGPLRRCVLYRITRAASNAEPG